ncbi:RNA-directed DNA polymerase (Reverse transcriptase), partial [Trifolium medium]|nr:RNA-directed DNA polymerase (Reverse transcriptase) [Trifolium medium]
ENLHGDCDGSLLAPVLVDNVGDSRDEVRGLGSGVLLEKSGTRADEVEEREDDANLNSKDFGKPSHLNTSQGSMGRLVKAQSAGEPVISSDEVASEGGVRGSDQPLVGNDVSPLRANEGVIFQATGKPSRTPRSHLRAPPIGLGFPRVLFRCWKLPEVEVAQSVERRNGLVHQIVRSNVEGGQGVQPPLESDSIESFSAEIVESKQPEVQSFGSGVDILVGNPAPILLSQGSVADSQVARGVIEAAKLLEIQRDLGVSFNCEDKVMVERLVEVEGRDRKVLEDQVDRQVRREKLDFLALQETKMEIISEVFVHNLWGNSDCCWAFSPCVGSSGGILSIWRKQETVLLFSFTGEGFLGVCLDWGVVPKRLFVINVYSKCDLAAKRDLWFNLLSFKNDHPVGEWCVLGDFNSVRAISERKGVNSGESQVLSPEMVGFNGFLEDLDLMDLPLLGRRFTWAHSNGVSMSRIDRILISEGWLDHWLNPSLWVLDRDISDHCPLLLRYSTDAWGPNPFRFSNRWLNHKGFEKLWNQVVFGNVDARVNLLVEEIKAADLRAELTGLTEAEADSRKKCFADLWILLKSKDAQMYQRSRAKWLKQGDENTGYFHACVKARRNQNRIGALKVEGEWVENPTRIREVIVDYFRHHFSSERWQRPTLEGVPFPCLSLDENESLVRPFSLEEIERVAEVRIMFDQFHGNARLPKGFTSFFVALIPKVESPFGVGDFRPISLLGCLYKLIAKVLASRLSLVMGSLIAIKGRQLMDGVVVVNEVIDFARRAKKECLILKVDFAKAYDSVEWSFLEYMLRRFGFNDKWCSWIKACVFAGNLSILVNGSPTEEISINKGLKQGDP